MDKFKWRTATADDAALLFEIFAAHKAAEFAPLGLPPEQLQPLLDMQFRARQLSYGQSCPNALDTILCLADGTPVGRQLVDRQISKQDAVGSSDCYRCIDIAVLPQYQGQGIGAWALQQIQQLAQLEGVSFRLSVIQTNPAVRLYERLGFTRISSNDVSFEMEWRPAASSTPQPPAVLEDVPLISGDILPRAQVLDAILPFLREIGLNVELGLIASSGFLPGIQMISNGLRIDLDALLYPGDLLHEAGHLAVMLPAQRHASPPVVTSDPGQEMAAIAWSYAAITQIGLPVEVLFHEHGYRGLARSFAQGFSDGTNRPGLPLLWYFGMTTQSLDGAPSIYPRMLHWLRANPAGSDAPSAGDNHNFVSLQPVETDRFAQHG